MPNERYDPSDSRYWEEPESYEPEDPDDDDRGDSDYWEDSSEEDNFDCGFVEGYGCQLAGTEECDFECPYRDALASHPDYPNVTIGEGLVYSEGGSLPETNEPDDAEPTTPDGEAGGDPEVV